jgi:hypothetical protein
MFDVAETTVLSRNLGLRRAASNGLGGGADPSRSCLLKPFKAGVIRALDFKDLIGVHEHEAVRESAARIDLLVSCP